MLGQSGGLQTIYPNHKNKLSQHSLFDDESIKLISKSAKGSVRDALTLLDQSIAYGNGSLKSDDIQKLLGTIDDSLLFELIDSIVDGNSQHAFNLLSEIEEISPEYDSILKDIIAILHKVSIHQALENSTDNRVIDITKKIDKEFCQLLYEIAINSYSKFSVHPNPKEALELCLLRMLTFNPLQKLSENNTFLAQITCYYWTTVVSLFYWFTSSCMKRNIEQVLFFST